MGNTQEEFKPTGSAEKKNTEQKYKMYPCWEEGAAPGQTGQLDKQEALVVLSEMIRFWCSLIVGNLILHMWACLCHYRT